MVDLLVDSHWLEGRIGDSDVVVVDCRFSLADPQAGRRAYAEGHIPGAVYADLESDLSAPVAIETGRHPLPRPESLAARFGAWGIGPDTQVVVYDDAGGAMAARLWWLARWLGHGRTALLDGGLAAWVSVGGELESDTPPRELRRFAASPNARLCVSADDLQAGLKGDALALIDARASDRFAGRVEPIDPVAGHVPGALNRSFVDNLDEEGRFRSPAELASAFRALVGARPAEAVVHMCGSGVTACHNLLAMELAGLHGSRLYPGSWSEWIRDPARPVARNES